MKFFWPYAFFLLHFSSIVAVPEKKPSQEQAMRLGLENISQKLITRLRGKTVGLVTNHTGKSQQGVATLEVLKRKGINVVAIFAPEHGFHGTVKAAADVGDHSHTSYKIPVISLYSNGSGKEITADMLKGIDVLMFDMQDVGMRHYTYLSTLFKVMQAASAHHKELIVLDRPNPLGGMVEGPLVEPALQSFISIAPIPLRHGMTFGELALYFNKFVLNNATSLEVVPMLNYHRTQQKTHHFVKNLSPNIPHCASCYGYSFLGLLGEIRPFDTGVGTAQPFCSIALPKSLAVSPATWQELGILLGQLHIPTTFCTYFNDRKKMELTGLRLNIKNINKVAAFKAFLTVVQFFKNKGLALTFTPDFDKAAGTPLVRQALMHEASYGLLTRKVNEALLKFYDQAKTVYLYKPWPLIGTLS